MVNEVFSFLGIVLFWFKVGEFFNGNEISSFLGEFRSRSKIDAYRTVNEFTSVVFREDSFPLK